MTDDLYGTDLALSPTGDLVLSPSGQLQTIADTDNAIQALTLRTRSSPGDLTLHPTYGSAINATLVGAKDDIAAARNVVSWELSRIASEDRRFLDVENVEVAAHPTASGLGLRVECEVILRGGERLAVSDLDHPYVSEIVDPADPYGIGQLDPLSFTAQDDAELDTLSDLALTQALQNDATL